MNFEYILEVSDEFVSLFVKTFVRRFRVQIRAYSVIEWDPLWAQFKTFAPIYLQQTLQA